MKKIKYIISITLAIILIIGVYIAIKRPDIKYGIMTLFDKRESITLEEVDIGTQKVDLSDIEDDIYDDDELDEDCDDLSFIEMECPNCNDLVEIDEELLYDDEVDVVCPNCKAIILSSDDDDYSCTDCDCEE